jgi:hypothetical protein
VPFPRLPELARVAAPLLDERMLVTGGRMRVGRQLTRIRALRPLPITPRALARPIVPALLPPMRVPLATLALGRRPVAAHVVLIGPDLAPVLVPRPVVTIPMVTIPMVTIPMVTIPMVTIPMVTIPMVTIPMVTIPMVAIPMVAIPSVAIPAVPRVLTNVLGRLAPTALRAGRHDGRAGRGGRQGERGADEYRADTAHDSSGAGCG